MYFGLSEEQKSLEENIQRFLADNAPLESIKAVADGDEEKAQAIHQGIIELGLSGLVVPEEYGGLELNMLLQLWCPPHWDLVQLLCRILDLTL